MAGLVMLTFCMSNFAVRAILLHLIAFIPAVPCLCVFISGHMGILSEDISFGSFTVFSITRLYTASMQTMLCREDALPEGDTVYLIVSCTVLCKLYYLTTLNPCYLNTFWNLLNKECSLSSICIYSYVCEDENFLSSYKNFFLGFSALL